MELGVMLLIWGISAVVNAVALYFMELKKRNFIPFKDLVIMALIILVPLLNMIIAVIFSIAAALVTVEYIFTYLGSKMTFNLVWKDGKFQRMKE